MDPLQARRGGVFTPGGGVFSPPLGMVRECLSCSKSPRTKTIMKQHLHVAHCDAHGLTRRGIASALAESGRYELAVDAADAEALVAALEQGARADVAVVDLGPPGLSGYEAIGRMRERRPTLRVLATAGTVDEHTVVHAYRSGAHGLFDKRGDAQALIGALDTVLGGQCFHTDFTQQVLLENPDGLTQEERSRRRMEAQLSPAQLLVMRQLCITADPTAVRLGADLGISPRTVERHLADLCEAFGVPSKLAMLIAAIRLGLVRP